MLNDRLPRFREYNIPEPVTERIIGHDGLESLGAKMPPSLPCFAAGILLTNLLPTPCLPISSPPNGRACAHRRGPWARFS